MITDTIRPVAPYRLAQSALSETDPTRTFINGILRIRLLEGSCSAYQTPDGSLVLEVEGGEAALVAARFCLGVDDDHRGFLELARRDRLLRGLAPKLSGLRQLRTATVTHALVKAIVHQQVQWRDAVRLERSILRLISGGGPPRRDQAAARSPAEYARLGVAERRAATLVRACRSIDVEALRHQPTVRVASRLSSQPGIGPWSCGVVCLQGLGRYDHGLVGDLSLIRICRALGARFPTAADTARLLEPYQPWPGLASMWLARHPLVASGRWRPDAEPFHDAPQAAG